MTCHQSPWEQPWPWIVGGFLLWMFVLWLRSLWKERQERQARSKAKPPPSHALHMGETYHLRLNDGTRFENVRFAGCMNGKDEGADFFLDAWQDAVVFTNAAGKQIYLKRPALRWVEQA